jgi:hypothetical protein
MAKIATVSKRTSSEQNPRVYQYTTPRRSAQAFGKRMDAAIEQKVKDAVRYTRYLIGVS